MDPRNLRFAMLIPLEKIREAHNRAKRELIEYVNANSGCKMKQDVLTIGFARRATPYKRMNLIFQDLERLKAINEKGTVQLVFAGKAHPRDQAGKNIIKEVYAVKQQLKGKIEVGFVENYDMAIAKKIIAGVDIWLNTPIPPREASGTSGMKAAHNGVPQLSIMDGWWIEGCIEGVTGWSIDDQGGGGDEEEAASLYDKLERVILPMFYNDPDGFANVMRTSIALNGSFFNTQRMLLQYIFNAYATAARA